MSLESDTLGDEYERSMDVRRVLRSVVVLDHARNALLMGMGLAVVWTWGLALSLYHFRTLPSDLDAFLANALRGLR
jgi:hypothetical protein